MKLTTDWITIGTSGPTVDGRKISDKMLTEAAETYDPDEYEAVISSDHLLWYYGNFGRVTELRTQSDKKDRVSLQAKIQPNKRLMEMNSQGQRLHTSMELTDDFANTGKSYLMGLAVTDEPASLGTSSLMFSRKEKCPVLVSQQTETINFSQQPNSHKADQEDDPGSIEVCGETFYQWFKNRFSKELNDQADTEDSEDTEMKDEQFSALKDLSEKQLAATTQLNQTLASFMSQKKETGSETTSETSETSETKEEDDKVLAALEKLSTRLTGVETQLSNAVKGKKGTELPAGTGAGQETVFV